MHAPRLWVLFRFEKVVSRFKRGSYHPLLVPETPSPSRTLPVAVPLTGTTHSWLMFCNQHTTAPAPSGCPVHHTWAAQTQHNASVRWVVSNTSWGQRYQAATRPTQALGSPSKPCQPEGCCAAPITEHACGEP